MSVDWSTFLLLTVIVTTMVRVSNIHFFSTLTIESNWIMNRSGDNIDDVIYIGFVCGRASSGEIKLNCKQINERISGICVPCHIQINLSFISSPPSPIQVCHAVLVAIANWSRSSPLTGKCSAKSCPRIEIYIWVGLKWHYISTSWVEVLCLCCPVLYVRRAGGEQTGGII